MKCIYYLIAVRCWCNWFNERSVCLICRRSVLTLSYVLFLDWFSFTFTNCAKASACTSSIMMSIFLPLGDNNLFWISSNPSFQLEWRPLCWWFLLIVSTLLTTCTNNFWIYLHPWIWLSENHTFTYICLKTLAQSALLWDKPVAVKCCWSFTCINTFCCFHQHRDDSFIN